MCVGLLFVLGCVQPSNSQTPYAETPSNQNQAPSTPTVNGIEEDLDVPSSNEAEQEFPAIQDEPAPPEKVEEQQPAVPLNVFRWDPEIPSEAERATLPDCEDRQFTVLPVDLGKVYDITPIGSLAPPGHTLPTDHSYLHVNAGGTSTETFELHAPADVFITTLWQQQGFTQDPEDDTIWFALCKDVYGYYNHVKELSPALLGLIEKSGCKGKPHTGANACSIKLLEPVKAGTVLGRVGRLQGNFDFGLFDLRKELAYANPSRYGTRTRYINCPYEYYTNEMRDAFYAKIARKDSTPCGFTVQDIQGKLKGNWFYEQTKDAISQWEYHLAFANDNKKPELQVISMGGVFSEAGKLEFAPKTSGTVNRRFEDVGADGKIYCYEGSTISGKVLVRVENADAIKIERQTGPCGVGESFSDARTYIR